MNARAGGTADNAASLEPDKPAEWTKHLRAELAAAMQRCVVTHSRWEMALSDQPVDLQRLADLSAESALLCGQVGGFAKLLLLAGHRR